MVHAILTITLHLAAHSIANPLQVAQKAPLKLAKVWAYLYLPKLEGDEQ